MMSKKLLMGNEAVALGAILAGVRLGAGYPGTPSTEILETLSRHNPGDIYVEWSVNEKVAMEVGAGASYAGGRVLVTMKQVGLNVASDPLLSLTYVGTNGGLVIAVADDPGPISSQTEQDTRHFGKFANLPVFDPSTPEEAFKMIQEGFRLSEEIKLPVILRLTTRVCHACSAVELPADMETVRYKKELTGFQKSSDWVIFPALAYRKHLYLEELQEKLARDFSESPFNSIINSGDSSTTELMQISIDNCKVGVAVGGNAGNYVLEALEELNLNLPVLKIGTPYPFPQLLAEKFLKGLDKVLVVEELDGVIEEALQLVSTVFDNRPVIFGKKSGHLPKAGEYSYELASQVLLKIMDLPLINPEKEQNCIPAAVELPQRPPVLCAGCPHRAAFYAVKKAAHTYKAVFTGDIGCYTLGNAKPLQMVDTCLCMGAGITIAQGLNHLEPDKKQIAFIGDSTFFHTGLPGIVNAVYNNADITIIVLNNSTTAMTGHQPHPGTGMTLMQNMSEKVDICGLLKACGVNKVELADPLDLKISINIVREAMEYKGPSAVVFYSPCIAQITKRQDFKIDKQTCNNCGRCLREIGCPALIREQGQICIESLLCMGCSFGRARFRSGLSLFRKKCQ